MNNENTMVEIQGLEAGRVTGARLVKTVRVSNANVPQIVRWEVRELERLTRYASNVVIPDEEDFNKYVNTLLYYRVCLATSTKIDSSVRALLNNLFIPARVSLLLGLVGEVTVKDINLTITPQFDMDADLIMSSEQLIEFSMMLGSFDDDGYTLVRGLKRSIYGDEHFMTKMAIVDGTVQDYIVGHKIENPVYAYFAWILQNELLETSYAEANMMFRVTYSSPGVYQASSARIWSSIKANKKSPEDESQL